MLRSLVVRNVREAYAQGIRLVSLEGIPEPSRNGPVYVLDGPLVTSYTRPWERVLLDPDRDANPFFHLMEAFWMLAGRRDVDSIMHYNAGMKKYSDDGKDFHGAYGHRWRSHFTREDHWCSHGDADTPLDQLQEVIRLLRKDPKDRRIVLQMWDSSHDLGLEGLDFPCNTQVYFRVRTETIHMPIRSQTVDGHDTTRVGGEPFDRAVLDMTVMCRSNDMLWGGYGANAVHFSVLHEFVAAMLGVRQGTMYQLSNNAHLYKETLPKAPPEIPAEDYGPTVPLFAAMSLVPVEDILADIEAIWEHNDLRKRFSPRALTADTTATILGMKRAWRAWKEKNWGDFLIGIGEMEHPDWQRACLEWGERRRDKFG